MARGDSNDHVHVRVNADRSTPVTRQLHTSSSAGGADKRAAAPYPRIRHIVRLPSQHDVDTINAIDADHRDSIVSRTHVIDAAVWRLTSAARLDHSTGSVLVAASATDFDALLGARVLVTQHAADKQSRLFHHIQQLAHPHVLALYGTCKTLYVCENGESLDALLDRRPQATCVVRVLRDVLRGLQSMHALGFAHGAVDTQHVVVGRDKLGKLLAHFCGRVDEAVEPELEDNAPIPLRVDSERNNCMTDIHIDEDDDVDDEQMDGDFHTKMHADERAFARSMLGAMERIVQPCATSDVRIARAFERGDTTVQARVNAYALQFKETRRVVAQVIIDTNNEYVLERYGAVQAIQRLADYEEDVFGKH